MNLSGRALALVAGATLTALAAAPVGADDKPSGHEVTSVGPRAQGDEGTAGRTARPPLAAHPQRETEAPLRRRPGESRPPLIVEPWTHAAVERAGIACG